MELARIFILLLPIISSLASHDEDCLVPPERTSKYHIINSFPYNIPMSIFLSSHEELDVQIVFKGKEHRIDSDHLQLSSDKCIVHRKRNREPKTENINCSNIIEGWHQANIIVTETALNIGSFLNYSLDYEIANFYTTANNVIYDCREKSPTWSIMDRNPVKFPVTGQESVNLILEAEEEFAPRLHMNGNFVLPLTWSNNSIAIIHGTTLPKGNYSILIYEESGKTIFIAQSIMYNCNVSLTNIGGSLDEIGISTSRGQFHSILYLNKTLRVIPQEEVSMKVLGKEKPNDSTWITWVFILWCATSFITVLVILYMKIKKKPTVIRQNTDLEGQQPLVNSSDLEARGKVDIEGLTEDFSQSNEANNRVMKIKKLKMKKEHHDPEKKIEKLILGPIDPYFPTKSILILGETGTGKSTTINAMINFIFGIRLEDLMRLILIESNEERKKDKHESQTDFMTAYFLPYKPGMPHCCNYIIIDTPGFGDTRGFERDQKIMLQLENFLKQDYNISNIDVIGFVVNAMTPRLTISQKYIYDGLFSMFGNDISHNIFLLVTFADDEDPPVLEVLTAANMQYSDRFLLNNESLYCGYNEDESSVLDYHHPEILKFNWTMSENSLKRFFDKLQQISSVSLSLTKIVLEENARLRSIVGNLDNQIKEGLNKITQLTAKSIESTSPEESKLNEQEIKHSEELLVISIKEAQHLTLRLKEIPLKLDPLSVHGYIDLLIANEQKDMHPNHEERIQILEKLRRENKVLKAVINEEKPPGEGWLHYFRKSKED